MLPSREPGGWQRGAVQGVHETLPGTFVFICMFGLNTTAGVHGCLTVRKCTDYMLLFRGGPASSWRMLHDQKTAAEGLSLISVLTKFDRS